MLDRAADHRRRVVAPAPQLTGEEAGELAEVGHDLRRRPLALGRQCEPRRVEPLGLVEERLVEPGVLAPDFVGVHSLSSTMRLRQEPIPSMAVSSTCPGARNTFGFRPAPTPAGVPVAMRSPGRSVVNWEV